MHLPEIYRPWIYLAAAFACYVVMMFTNPAREALRDGFRCLLRYPAIWMLLAMFGLCYAVFQIQKDVYDYYSFPEGMHPVFQWSRPWFLPHRTLLNILKTGVLPALEQLSGLFNVFIIMFPFSAVASVLFLLNWEGHHAVLVRSLRKRFDGWGWFIYAGIVVCALAAIVQPLIYGALFLKVSGVGRNDLL